MKQIALLVALLAGAAANAQIANAELKALQASTVLVRGRANGFDFACTGVVVLKENRSAVVAVPAMQVAECPAESKDISITLDSGAKNVRTVPGLIVARCEGLAFLRIENDALPEPVVLNQAPELRETQSINVLGFSASDGHSVAAIASGAISSLRRDESTGRALIQIDAKLSASHNGALLLNADGVVAGIVLGRIQGTQIAMALPAPAVLRTVLGGINSVYFDELDQKENARRLSIQIEFCDPAKKVQSVDLLFCPRIAGCDVKMNAAGEWEPAVKEMTRTPLKIDNGTAHGEISLPDSPDGYVYQIQVSVNGLSRLSRPDSITTRIRQPEIKSSVRRDWISSTQPAAGVVAGPAAQANPQPPQGNPQDITVAPKVLLSGKRDVVDGKLSEVGVIALNTIPNMFWSADGKFLYQLEARGVLRKMEMPNFRENRVLEVGSNCTWIDQCKEGVLVCVYEKAENWLWVIDEGTLEVKRKLVIPGCFVVRSAPGLSVAYGFSRERHWEVTIIDVVKGTTKKESFKDLSQRPAVDVNGRNVEAPRIRESRSEAISPDGKYMFCGADGMIHRLAIRGNELIYEQSTVEVVSPSHYSNLIGSPDAAYVAYVVGNGNNGQAFPNLRVGQSGIYIFKNSDLKTPALGLPFEEGVRALGFDKAARKLYLGSDNAVTVYSGTTKQKTYPLYGTKPRQILVHPDGGKLLILLENVLRWLELPQ